MDVGGRWGNEVWADLCSERRIKLQFQEVGAHPWILFGCNDKDETALFAQDTLLSGQFAQQWGLRMTAQGAARKEAANSKLRRFLA